MATLQVGTLKKDSTQGATDDVTGVDVMRLRNYDAWHDESGPGGTKRW